MHKVLLKYKVIDCYANCKGHLFIIILKIINMLGFQHVWITSHNPCHM